jgi:hypothetical protein
MDELSTWTEKSTAGVETSMPGGDVLIARDI